MLGRCYYFISANAIKKKFFFCFLVLKECTKKIFFFIRLRRLARTGGAERSALVLKIKFFIK